MKPFFPIGARVLVDGLHDVKVAQIFPAGSSSFHFPHYKVNFVKGDKNVVIRANRVGVERKVASPTWNVWRFTDEGGEKMDLIAIETTEDAALDAAYRYGGDQIQKGVDGEIRNIDRRNWFPSAKQACG